MDASFEKRTERYTLALERSFSHPPEKVWRVLTERDHLKRWFPCDIEGEWKVGAPLRFIFLHGEGEGMPEESLRGEVLTVDPPRLLEFRWDKHIIRCELVPEDDGCKLLFSETLDDPSTAARNAAGWELCLDNLDVLVQAGTVAKFAWDLWQAKFKHYVAKFEPEFGSQQGPPQGFTAAERGDDP